MQGGDDARKPSGSDSRARAADRQFVKSPGPQIVEIAALSGLDFVLLDAEHAPYSAGDVDRAVLAGRAANISVLVRVPSHVGPWIQQVLDCGADGIVVPHVESVAVAEAVVRAARFAGGGRGYSNSPRAGGYGTLSMAAMLAQEDGRVVVVAQIEDLGGVDQVNAIAAVDGVDALFIGRADLAVALGATGPDDPTVGALAAKVAAAAAARGLPCGTFLADARAVAAERASGVSFFVIGSDQSTLRTGWRDMVGTFCEVAGPG